MLSKRIELSSRFKTRAAISVLFFLAVIFFFLINLTDRTNQNKRSVYTRRIAAAVNDSELDSGHNGHEVTEEHQEEIPYVVLFPWFAQLIGIFAYWIISRYAHGIPYTAVMFITGAIMGFYSERNYGNAIVESMKLWLGINGEVIILTFLPGLLFLDSYNINVHLFVQSFWQLVVFAFPMVLAGTSITALFAYYIFPYGWSFDLCMTFGSILAATDPVAVAVLLNELGAPSRLKIHISGESLMNDGSAVVFYHIFSSRFFYELGVDGFGEKIGWARGFALFFRLAFGGACIGLAFGVGLVTLLFNFNRRLSQEENVIQVTSTITVAYMAFFVSEILAGCSGIIAVLFCGVTVKAFGETLMNDSHLTHDFWEITEHLLNTTLFCLGGAVWGGVHSGKDWIYLLILFAAVILIRFFLVFAFFPITSRMGISQSWREAIFMSYAGLRGAVGVALALLLSAEIYKYTENVAVSEDIKNQYRQFADELFGFVGGVAFLTLVINGPTSGPLLKTLGLVTPTDTRKNVVRNYEHHMQLNTLVEYLALLSEKRFENVDYGIVREHVSPLKNITPEEMNNAVETFQRKHPSKTPNLENLGQYLLSNGNQLAPSIGISNQTSTISRNRNGLAANLKHNRKKSRGTVYDFRAPLDKSAVLEQRLIFIDLLRREYHHQLAVGELDSRGFIPFSLLQSLEFAENSAAKGHPLCDWMASQSVGDVFTKKGDRLLHAYRVGGFCNRKGGDEDFHVIRTQVLQALSFIKAHLAAQQTFKEEFASVSAQALTLAEKAVLDESKEQVAKADAAINNFDEEDVNAVKSQYVCQILLFKSANYFEKLSQAGLMTEKEAGEFLEQYDHELRQLRLSSELKTEIRHLNNQIAPEIPAFSLNVLETIHDKSDLEESA